MCKGGERTGDRTEITMKYKTYPQHYFTCDITDVNPVVIRDISNVTRGVTVEHDCGIAIDDLSTIDYKTLKGRSRVFHGEEEGRVKITAYTCHVQAEDG